MLKPNLAKRVAINVSNTDIHESECRDPNKCMIKVAVARALRIPHGYIHVDATGISVTRRDDFREKAFLPKTALKNMLKFDKKQYDELKPFRFMAEFHKTTKVVKSTAKRKARINELRNARLAAGIKPRKYNLKSRVVGIAFSKDLLK